MEKARHFRNALKFAVAYLSNVLGRCSCVELSIRPLGVESTTGISFVKFQVVIKFRIEREKRGLEVAPGLPSRLC